MKPEYTTVVLERHNERGEQYSILVTIEAEQLGCYIGVTVIQWMVERKAAVWKMAVLPSAWETFLLYLKEDDWDKAFRHIYGNDATRLNGR